MKIEIKNRFSGAILYECEAESLHTAVVKAVRELRINLRGADLQSADLRGADLRGADLRGAKGIEAWRSTSLMMLLDQPGRIRAYKLVNESWAGPFNGGIVYSLGSSFAVPDASTDPAVDCAAGINVATFDWCARQWRPGYNILIVEFEAQDIAAIPLCTDGKFRLHRCTVVGEKDLVAAGLMTAPQGDGGPA